jgi:hypothetical protein
MYRFVANSMFIFAVALPSGLIKNVEFEACGVGVYSYMTDNKQVAEAIRNHPLTKQGRITDKSEPEEPEQVAEKPVDGMDAVKDPNVLHFDNITKAKNYLAKEFKVDTRGLKSPASVKAKAKELGVDIDF